MSASSARRCAARLRGRFDDFKSQDVDQKMFCLFFFPPRHPSRIRAQFPGTGDFIWAMIASAGATARSAIYGNQIAHITVLLAVVGTLTASGPSSVSVMIRSSVLNMDHHCPWVNNCIGFENRKYFIQLLCYALICVLCVAVHG